MWSVCLFSLVSVYTLICLSNGQNFRNWENVPGRFTGSNAVRSNPNQLSRDRFSFNRNWNTNSNRVNTNSNRMNTNSNRVNSNSNRWNGNNQISNHNQFSNNNRFSNNNQFPRNRNNQFHGNNNHFSNNHNSFNNRGNSGGSSRHNQLAASTMNLLLKFINLHRQGVDAQNMYVMKWSNTLARQAGARSQTCQLLHRNSTSGESLIVVPQQSTGDKVAEYINKHWIAEKNDFRLGTDCRLTTPNSCAYSQMIWAQSKTMGCASHWCASSQLVVCLFDPPGNGYGALPYIKGNHCQQCPRDTIRCDNQLCDWRNMNGK